VSINNKYTLIPAERVPKSDEQPFSEAFVEQQAFISTRFPRFPTFSDVFPRPESDSESDSPRFPRPSPSRAPETQRPTGVQIEAQNLSGKKFKMTLDGFEARVFQHEYDHLDGVLFNDRMTDEVRGTIQSKLDALVEKHPEGYEKAL